MNRIASNDYLGTEKISRLIFRLALPTVTAQLVNMLYNLVDRVYIGHNCRTHSNAAVATGSTDFSDESDPSLR